MIPKFRAWLKQYKKMVDEVNDMTFKEGSLEYIGCSTVDGVSFQHCVDDIILMQSTGLFDKNGKEIFEGDIVQFEDYYIESDLPYINRGIVEWSQGQFTITNRASVEMEDLLDGEFLDLTIIGNIYENQELLEVE